MSPAAERLASLRAELELGRRELAALDERRAELRDTLLRIGGAIRVLEELIEADPAAAAEAAGR